MVPYFISNTINSEEEEEEEQEEINKLEEKCQSE
jgi:hypothetical protein